MVHKCNQICSGQIPAKLRVKTQYGGGGVQHFAKAAGFSSRSTLPFAGWGAFGVEPPEGDLSGRRDNFIRTLRELWSKVCGKTAGRKCDGGPDWAGRDGDVVAIALREATL